MKRYFSQKLSQKSVFSILRSPPVQRKPLLCQFGDNHFHGFHVDTAVAGRIVAVEVLIGVTDYIEYTIGG